MKNEPRSAGLTDATNAATPSKSRKRKQNSSINISGVSKLKQSMLLERSKQIDKTIAENNEENENEENFEDENEQTSNDLESLKMSVINHAETTTGGRLTRSAKALLNKNTKENLIGTSSNKRSRSPLTSNNSINETLEPNSILTSTRIETRRMTSKTVRSSIGITAIGKDTEIEDEMENSVPVAKRKRRSDEQEHQEIAENNNLIQV